MERIGVVGVSHAELILRSFARNVKVPIANKRSGIVVMSAGRSLISCQPIIAYNLNYTQRKPPKGLIFNFKDQPNKSTINKFKREIRACSNVKSHINQN